MVKLCCAIVGAAGNAFSVDINDTESVAALKKGIKKKNPNTIKCDANRLQLFLAKTEGGVWIDEAGAASVALDERGYPQGYVQMRATLDQESQAFWR
ncbi:CRN-like protein [Plasmopara halstedii]|uniref:CRN-like protein n=1 Tax=Plasmopara halstedii TaxID=4781 RepID=A0A0P1B2G8_PLAHL|nr:CRN-like protein [Plasmopara halstedii]CEG47517.1 CRN-like protein [Plasmopara halstedii]|eukprot:XP_024583886.1 CRN-like protein [Plasmopara halstedii]